MGSIKDLLFNYAEDIKRLKEELYRRNIIKMNIQKEFDFIVPDYIIDDIIIEENYRHVCLMINMAKLNNELTENNAIILKEKIKQMYNIKKYSQLYSHSFY